MILNTRYTKKEFEKLLTEKLFNEFAIDIASATDEQIYRALALIARGMLSEKRKRFIARTYGANGKQVYYLCMEFLMGRSLKTSLLNLGLCGVADEVLRDYSMKLDNIYEQEPDAGLGNGGLGRLAACYLDGMATDDIPGTGYSILYEYGIFKQKIVDGWQQERADNWLPGGGVWLKSHPDQAVEVRFDGEIEESWDGSYHCVKHKNYSSVLAVPSDMFVAGYDSAGVSKLRLWRAKAPGFDMSSFNAGQYGSAIAKNANAELISKVLYPNDNHMDGKILRLRQQYFLSSASVNDIVKTHLSQYATLDNLPDKVAIHINDTHPTLAIPELMRILLDECGFTWEHAFDITRRTFAYTNHTVMSEALEKWNIDIFKKTLPRIYQICEELDRRCRADFERAFPGDTGKINYMAILGDNQVRMANICCYVCHSINGVSKLHSDIIKQSVFHDYFLYSPEKFTNVTNGIAYRRWLLASNPALTKLLSDTIQKIRISAEKFRKIRGRPKRAEAAGRSEAQQQGGLCRASEKSNRPGDRPGQHLRCAGKAHARIQAPAPERTEHCGAVFVCEEQPECGCDAQDLYLRRQSRAGVLYGKADDTPHLQAGPADRCRPGCARKAACGVSGGLLRHHQRAADARQRGVRADKPCGHRGIRHRQHEIHAERRRHPRHAGRRQCGDS